MSEPHTENRVLPEPHMNLPGTRHDVQTFVLVALTLAGTYVCLRLAAPFLPVLVWALALAILCAPLHRWLETRFGHPGVAAGLCVLTVAIVVIVPGAFIATRVVSEAAAGAEVVQGIIETGGWRRSFEAHPALATAARWVEQQFDLSGIVESASLWLTEAAASFLRGSVLQVVGIVLTFYMFYFFLRDRVVALDSLKSMSPLSAVDTDRLFAGVADTVHATLNGTLVIAVIQGTLGGLMFWWLGLTVPLLWGIVMGLLAVVPVLGAFIIWIPAAIFLFLDGSGGKALVLTLWGGIVVGGIDNLLYPKLVGTRLKMHTVFAFISIIGGLILFGSSGLILGPVLFTVTRLLLEIWGRDAPMRPSS